MLIGLVLTPPVLALAVGIFAGFLASGTPAARRLKLLLRCCSPSPPHILWAAARAAR